jgi:hypothetical protein
VKNSVAPSGSAVNCCSAIRKANRVPIIDGGVRGEVQVTGRRIIAARRWNGQGVCYTVRQLNGGARIGIRGNDRRAERRTSIASDDYCACTRWRIVGTDYEIGIALRRGVRRDKGKRERSERAQPTKQNQTPALAMNVLSHHVTSVRNDSR